MAADATVLDMNAIIKSNPCRLADSCSGPNDKIIKGFPGVMKGMGAETIAAQTKIRITILLHKRIEERDNRISVALIKNINIGSLKSELKDAVPVRINAESIATAGLKKVGLIGLFNESTVSARPSRNLLVRPFSFNGVSLHY